MYEQLSDSTPPILHDFCSDDTEDDSHFAVEEDDWNHETEIGDDDSDDRDTC